ncbi:hypothetical protein [uncultured Duncaniella sp.]|uniref:hypothetical protein n=1 Tax=uncultured Duncaniella sp. TaxID=2768039 RepID=UPI002619AC72|nr:hypothetical protein [uncultured Duncaniella sp.]
MSTIANSSSTQRLRTHAFATHEQADAFAAATRGFIACVQYEDGKPIYHVCYQSE